MNPLIFKIHRIEDDNGLAKLTGVTVVGNIEGVKKVRAYGKGLTESVSVYKSYHSHNGQDVIELETTVYDGMLQGADWLVEREVSSPFLEVEEVFAIQRGLVVTGVVQCIPIKTGDELTICHTNGKAKSVKVLAIESSRIIIDTAYPGRKVGLMLDDDAQEYCMGDLLCKVPLPPTVQDAINTINRPKQKIKKKVALLIGNESYSGSASLQNCVRDARAIGNKLHKLGFDVLGLENGTKEAIDNSINTFFQHAKDADVAYVFYSGHGIQYNGENYIIPVDAIIYSESDLEYKCNRASYLLAKMNDANCKLKVLVLDACRVNPFTKSWYKGNSYSGLGVMNGPKGTLIAYATSPNEVAYDGINSNNSPYTQGLLALLDEKDLDLVNYFNKVSSFVYNLTGGKQNPWFSCSAITDDFFFNESREQTSGYNNAPTQSKEKPKHKSNSYSIYLTDVGDAKLILVKVLREFLNTSLHEAKRLVDNAPIRIAENVDEAFKNTLTLRLSEVGAKYKVEACDV